MWSVPSRRRLASQARIRWWRERPASFGPSPIAMRAFVASRTRSRRPASAWPRISSEAPAEYTSAVSIRFTPASRHKSIWRRAPSTSVEPTLANLPPPPKVIVPRVSAETRRPERPSWRYSMRVSLGWVQHAHGLPTHPRGDVLDRIAVEHLVGARAHVAEVGGEQRARRLADRMVLRQRLLGVDVERGARDRALAQRLQQHVLVDDRAARGVDEDRRPLHQAQLARADEPARAVAQPRVDRQHVRALEQLVARHRLDAGLGGRLRREVLAPRDHVHLERLRDARDAPAELPQPEDAERAARQLGADRALPAAVADAPVLLEEVALQRDDQPPCELGGRGRQRRGPADRDPELAGGLHVDRGVGHPGRHEQLENGQRGQPRGGEGRALAHRHYHLEALQQVAHDAVDEQMVVEEGDLGVGLERLPRTDLAGDLLVVVEHGDLDRHGRKAYARAAESARRSRRCTASSASSGSSTSSSATAPTRSSSARRARRARRRAPAPLTSRARKATTMPASRPPTSNAVGTGTPETSGVGMASSSWR